jgi:hypothetical protein
MTSSQTDAAPLNLALTELRLPTIKALWPRLAEQADKEGWPAARMLSALAEHELAERTVAASSDTWRKPGYCQERR